MLLMIIDYDRPLLILSTWTCYSWVQKFQWLLREEIKTQLYGIICLQPTFSSHIFNSIFILYTLITNTLSHLLFPFSGGDFSYSSQFSFSWNLYMFQLKNPPQSPPHVWSLYRNLFFLKTKMHTLLCNTQYTWIAFISSFMS